MEDNEVTVPLTVDTDRITETTEDTHGGNPHHQRMKKTYAPNCCGELVSTDARVMFVFFLRIIIVRLAYGGPRSLGSSPN